MIAGKIDKNKLNEIELARVVRLSFCISLMTNVVTSYSEIPEKPGGLYRFDHSSDLWTKGRPSKNTSMSNLYLVKIKELIFPTYIVGK